MSKQLFLLPFLLLLVFATCTYADPIPVFPPFPPPFPVKDYIRGTIGEPLFVGNTHLAGRHDLRITNELRYCEYSAYWDTAGRRQDLDAYDYSRFANFLSIDFGLTENVEIGARIPFVGRSLKHRDGAASNKGIGDLLLRVRADPFGKSSEAIRIALGAGIKIPTGEYDIDEELPTGTGSTDFSFMAYGSCDLKVIELYADMGYVVTGKTEFNRYIDQNLGDVFSYDIALVRAFAPFVSCIVEVNGYTITSSETDEGWKTDDGQHRFTVCPRLASSIPGINLKIEGGFSYDLFGSSALRGATPLLRMKVER